MLKLRHHNQPRVHARPALSRAETGPAHHHIQSNFWLWRYGPLTRPSPPSMIRVIPVIRGGVKVVVTSRKVTIRSIEPLSVFWQEKTAYSSRFHASCSRISSKGLLILWGHCSEHIHFNSLRHLTLFMVNG